MSQPSGFAGSKCLHGALVCKENISVDATLHRNDGNGLALNRVDIVLLF